MSAQVDVVMDQSAISSTSALISVFRTVIAPSVEMGHRTSDAVAMAFAHLRWSVKAINSKMIHVV